MNWPNLAPKLLFIAFGMVRLSSCRHYGKLPSNLVAADYLHSKCWSFSGEQVTSSTTTLDPNRLPINAVSSSANIQFLCSISRRPQVVSLSRSNCWSRMNCSRLFEMGYSTCGNLWRWLVILIFSFSRRAISHYFRYLVLLNHSPKC